MSAYAAIGALLAGATGIDRVYQGRAASGADLPYVVMKQLTGTPRHNATTAMTTAEETYQLDIYAATAASRETIKEAVRNALDGYRGTSGSVRIQGVFLFPPLDDVGALDSGRQAGEWTSTIDARVMYERAEPTG